MIMMRVIQIILLSLLSFTFQGIASNVSTLSSVEVAKHCTYFPVKKKAKVDVSECPYYSVVEIVESLHSHYVSIMRAQRIQANAYFLCLKTMMRSYTARVSTLYQHWERICGTYVVHSFKRTLDFHVFALKHIII